MGGWEEPIIRLSSVQLQLNVPVRAELGKINLALHVFVFIMSVTCYIVTAITGNTGS